MSYIYKHISDIYDTTLINVDELNGREVKSMSVCNTHATDSVDIDLFYYRSETHTAEANTWDDPGETTYTYYLVKTYTILKGTTLQLNDGYDIVFDNSKYDFRIRLSAVDSTVDVIITTG